MNRKLLSAMIAAVMLFASLVILIPGDTDAASTEPITVHPVPGDRMPWVSKEAIPYYSHTSLYYTEDPYEEAVKFSNGEVTLDYMKTVCGYSPSPPMGETYYSISFDSGYSNINYNMNYHKDVVKPGPSSQWFTNNLYFTENPYSEVVRYANGEITLEQLKTRCGYTDQSDIHGDYSNYYYVTDYGSTLGIQRNANRNLPAGMYGLNGEGYFTTDPYNDVVKYLNEEINLTELKTRSGYTPKSSLVNGNSYYVVSISGWNGYSNDDFSDYVRYISVQPSYMFLDKGTYHINVTDTDLSYVNIRSLNSNSRYDSIDITDRAGSGNFKVTSPDAIWLSDYSGGGGGGETSLDKTWREKSITFTIDPAPSSGEKASSYNGTVKVLPDKEWVKMTTVDDLTGTYTSQTSGEVMFISGSDEEREFVENVVDKGLMDASGYGLKTVTLTGQKVVIYECRETSAYLPDSIYLMTDSTDKGYSYSERFECKTEKLSVSDVEPYKFYAKYDFTLAVKYDTSKVKAIVMMYPNGFGGTEYSVLQSERLYNFHMLCAAEYELYAIPVSSTDGTLHPIDIEIYTENVASPDGNGVTFAVVAIALCVIAFGILFLASRRPKWNEATGLPSGDAEIVQNEVPEEPPKD